MQLAANAFDRSCTLTVKIKNKGDTAFQTETYGDAIQVERTFGRAGASSFKLKTSTGRVVSTRKADLDEISDYFALQLDNPISVLSQDMARSFLSSSSAQDKYNFFVKGVSLEQLHHDYQLLEENIEQIQAVFDERQTFVEQLKTVAVNAQALLDLAGKQDTVRARMKSLGIQMAWSQVEDQENSLRNIEDRITEVTRDIDTAQKNADLSASLYGEKDRLREQAKRAVEVERERKEPLDEERGGLHEALESSKANVQDLLVDFLALDERHWSLTSASVRIERYQKRSRRARRPWRMPSLTLMKK